MFIVVGSLGFEGCPHGDAIANSAVSTQQASLFSSQRHDLAGETEHEFKRDILPSLWAKNAGRVLEI